MPLEGATTRRGLPDKRAGMRGIEDWLLGRKRYAHPALRWASMPLFRLAWVAFLVNVFQGFPNSVAFAVFVVLLAVSSAAECVNWLLLRRQRTRGAAA